MQVDELHHLTRWIDRHIRAAEILNFYEQLHAPLSHNASKPDKQPFEEQKTKLLEALRAVPLSQLSNSQIQVLEEIGIGENIGERGADKIEGILYRNVIDEATAQTHVREAYLALNEGVDWAGNLSELLGEIESEYAVETETDEIPVRVQFSGDASLNNLSDLKKWGSDWFDIGRGIAMATGETPQDIRILGASKGSILFTLATTPSIIGTLALIILSVLEVTERVFRIRKVAQEVRQLNLLSRAEELEAEAEDARKTGADEVTATVAKKLNIDIGTSRQGDKYNALEGAVRRLLNFTESGGEVDFVLPPESEDDGTEEDQAALLRKTLTSTFQEIRELEQKVRQLEHTTKSRSE